MKRHIKYLAGSALGLLMAGSGASAQTQAIAPYVRPAAATLMAQDDTANPEELPRKKRQKPSAESEAPAAEPQASPAGEPQAEPEGQPKLKKGRKQAAEPEAPAAAPEAAPGAEPQAQPEGQPKLKKRQKQAAEPEAPAAAPEAAPAAEPQAEPEGQPQPKKRQKQAAEPEAPAAALEAAPAAEPQAEPEGQPQPKKRQKQAAEPEAPAAAPEAAPAAEPQAQPEGQPQPKKRQKQAEQPSTEQETAPAPEQPGMAEPNGVKRKKATGDESPARTGEPPADSVVPPDSGTAGDGSNAPVFDSAKEAPGKPKGGKAGKGEATPAAPAEPMAPPPADDRAAQEKAGPANIRPVTEEAGQRVDQPPQFERRRPKGVGVVKEDGDRVVVEIDNQPFVESSDRPRLGRGASDVYYEDLPQNRSRETVVRGDGTKVVTIRNAYGDIVRRSRITPDGREYVLVYVDDRDAARLDDWRDPGLDLPPMRLDVPEADYILDADSVDDPDVYYDFLERPPVERVERLYSVDEVKRSARIRDKVPRIELDTLTFEFGSASIAESEVPKLEGVAQAIEKILKRNPAETFLIEGHTDAVGSDVANLALSDRRAEAVAEALTNVFEIPPENLATQGYGERYLKVRTEEPEQVNRRVVIRRITPLVAPVASAN